MKLAKVVGTVVASQKDPSLESEKLLMIQPLDDDLAPVGQVIAAVDAAQAGPGDLVHWIIAREASLVMKQTFAPVDAAITGIVDEVHNEKVPLQDRETIFGS